MESYIGTNISFVFNLPILISLYDTGIIANGTAIVVVVMVVLVVVVIVVEH